MSLHFFTKICLDFGSALQVYTSPNMYYQKTKGDGNSSVYAGNVKFGFDYDFDEKNTTTFFVNYTGYNFDSEGNGNSFNNNNNVLQYSYISHNNNFNVNSNLSFYGFYKKSFEKKGNELLIDVMYTMFNNPSDSKMKWNYSNRIGRPEMQNSNTDITAKTLILKTDYILPVNTNRL